MRLMVLTAGVFPSEAEARSKMWIFLRSAEKAGVASEDLHIYGIGRGFGGYRHMKLDCQIDYLKEHRQDGYSHVLYHDGWDGFFSGSLTEVLRKYEAMGSPKFLISASTGLGNVPSPDADYPGCFDPKLRYRYPCVGGYMADMHHAVDVFERMLTLPRQTGDDCFNYYDAWQEGWFRPTLDSNCEIFQVTDQMCEMCWVGGHGQPGSVLRLRNTSTGSYPCLTHISGGYTSSDYGKDDQLLPWVLRLGILTRSDYACV